MKKLLLLSLLCASTLADTTNNVSFELNQPRQYNGKFVVYEVYNTNCVKKLEFSQTRTYKNFFFAFCNTNNEITIHCSSAIDVFGGVPYKTFSITNGNRLLVVGDPRK
jgi:hypothetical protein